MSIETSSGAPVARLALGAREDRDPECVAIAAENGINFFFFYHLGGGEFAAAVGEVSSARRDDFVIATGSGSRDPDSLRRALESYLAALHTDHLDIFFSEYIQPDEDLDAIFGAGGALDELARWKEDGVVRYVGATAHDRAVSRRLAEDARLDVLMTRYNMAHRKASTGVFPACEEHDVALVTFTATRWGTLLEGHPDWEREPPTAADCYGFCLAHPAIDVVLGAPMSSAELEESLAALDAPVMSDDERARWERYGDLIYGDGTDAFETQWP